MMFFLLLAKKDVQDEVDLFMGTMTPLSICGWNCRLLYGCAAAAALVVVGEINLPCPPKNHWSFSSTACYVSLIYRSFV